MENTTAGAGLKDRKTGLVVFGVFEILLGAIFALMIPLIILSMVVTSRFEKGPGSPVSAGTMIPGLLFYVLMAAWFIWMGVGSILARRWARALLLVTSWFWFISGLFGLVFMLVFMPDMYDQMGRSGQMPQQIATAIRYVTIGLMAVFYIIIPGAFILFYGSKHTKATCEQRDPRIRWTDKCPLPVLAVSLISGCWAICMPLMGFYGWAMPFFGIVLSGIAGAAVALVGSLLFGYVAWGMYRLSMEAWWCAVLLIITWGISSGITFSHVNLMEFCEKMNFPDQQLDMMKQFATSWEPWMALICGLWVVVALAYLFYTKRYFALSAEQRSVSPSERV